MSIRTAEEAKQNYIAVMGDPLGSLFHSLWQEVTWLYRRWDNYVGGEHAIDPSRDGARMDHVLVLAEFDGIADKIGDAPNDADEFALVDRIGARGSGASVARWANGPVGRILPLGRSRQSR